jgi:hypothetical protein
MFFFFAGDDGQNAQPISLYLDLEPGQVADIEVVARAALAFSKTIKEIIYVLDPSLDIRVEIASGTPGSLSLDSVIRSLKEKAEARPILAATVVLLFSWFGNYGFTEGLDALRGKDNLSAEEIAEIADKVVEAMDKRVAQDQVQSVYQELERDTRIKGVGVTTVAGTRPDDIVPREQFAIRSDPAILTEVTTETRRSRKRRETVVIVRPVLLKGTRRWRFNSAEGEFGAQVKDEAFVEKLLSGRLMLPMTGGVELDVLLETEEHFLDGVWVPAEWTVWEVYGHKFPPRQASLFSQGPEE